MLKKVTKKVAKTGEKAFGFLFLELFISMVLIITIKTDTVPKSV